VHPNPIAERLRRQITEGGMIQAVGRARLGLRKANEPLDIYILTDIPVPELGPVEPMLWEELETGLDGLMLAQGCWLSNSADAERVHKGLITPKAVKNAREQESDENEFAAFVRGLSPRVVLRAKYQRAGSGAQNRRCCVSTLHPQPPRVPGKEAGGQDMAH
jgi:hypothetical protein